MRKRLFEHYVELNCYRIVTQQLYQHKLLNCRDYHAVLAKISQAELNLIVPRQSKSHPRTLTRVK